MSNTIESLTEQIAIEKQRAATRFPCHQCSPFVDIYGRQRTVAFQNVTDLNIHIERNHNRGKVRSQADIDAAARILAKVRA